MLWCSARLVCRLSPGGADDPRRGAASCPRHHCVVTRSELYGVSRHAAPMPQRRCPTHATRDALGVAQGREGHASGRARRQSRLTIYVNIAVIHASLDALKNVM